MTTQLRVLGAEHWDHWFGRLERAFGGVPDPADERQLWRELTEVERSLAVWDDDEVVGTSGAFSFRLSVPGGVLVPAAGITMVSVQPTHRRRGLLTAMMRRLLDDARERGEPLAVLETSEPPIYGRFGFGNGTENVFAEIDTSRVHIDAPRDADAVRLRIAAPQDAVAACEKVYAARVAGRPGAPARKPGWERLPLLAPHSESGATGELLCVLAETDGEVSGYARYVVRPEVESSGRSGAVRLRDLEALDPVTYGALWRYLFDIDLTSRISVDRRPPDDPLWHMVSDIRRCRLTVQDAMYVRLVDVGAALRARTYAAPVDVVFEVEDVFCPWNAGRWRLMGDAEGAVCERSSDAADLALTARELGSGYLGGFALSAMAGAGRVRELRPGALAEASTAFRSDVAPWLPHGF
ncbi:GNAT family N-acetyltransferase [Streptomyces sp. RB6PN25]|uniref:GNAT family N-acetyltransferase n=1 Tax=Streptomyces humicola TaxID=2953240 RepID=A0ABT1PW70_9ACTN|nr:GNAT family N-acetyltransferase [Streptomyces humicola]MCQ4081897.1 GNAT family N-acetyltransferase [Streptomyces humicola]